MNEQSIPIDYYVNITISDDKLIAYIHFTNVDERFTITREQLETVLINQHVIHGVHHDVLTAIASDLKPFVMKKTILASGDSAIDGEDGQLLHMFDLDDESKRPTEQDDGTVNFKDVAQLHNVHKGEIVSRRIPAKEGVNGRAVTGEALFAKKGKEARFKVGKNVVVDSEQTAMFAAIDGMVSKTERDKVNVFPVFEVNGDVDYNIGNIDFVGTVVIRGNVLPGFRVKSAGDIRITGGVEAAEVEAGGSIEISAGILGQNKAVLKAGKNIKSSFIQDAYVEAVEDITVSQSIMHSTIRAGRNVICKGTKGLIVGGLIQAGERVGSRTVGNSMSTNTVLEVGVLPELRNELQQLRLQLKQLMENMEKTDKALAILDQLAAAGQLTPDKLAMRIKFMNTKKIALDEQSTMKERILELEKTLEDTSSARVEVSGVIYGGTKIVIGRYTKYIKDPFQRVYFILQDGDVATLPLV